MLNAELYVAKHKATNQESQNKKLFSDIAIGAFREKTIDTHKITPPPASRAQPMRRGCSTVDPKRGEIPCW